MRRVIITKRRFGSLEICDGHVSGFHEKTNLSMSSPVNAGVYALSASLLAEYGDAKTTSFERDIVTRMVEDRAVEAAFCDDFIDIGVPASYAATSKFIADNLRRPCAFLDRDGVVIEDTHYVDDSSSAILMPGAVETLLLLRDLGYYLVVVSNQSGIARGKFTLSQLTNVTSQIRRQLFGHGVHVDSFLYCPHHPSFPIDNSVSNCWNRKPNPGMLESALARFPIRKEGSFLLGDKDTDMAAAAKFGIPSAMVDASGPYNVVQQLLAQKDETLSPLKQSGGELSAEDLEHVAGGVIAVSHEIVSPRDPNSIVSPR